MAFTCRYLFGEFVTLELCAEQSVQVEGNVLIITAPSSVLEMMQSDVKYAIGARDPLNPALLVNPWWQFTQLVLVVRFRVFTFDFSSIPYSCI